jgi:hypothetical protein
MFALLAICLLTFDEGQSADDKPDMTVRPDHKVSWSKVIDAGTLAALKTGRLRLGITVNAFRPPNPGPRAFVVRLANACKAEEVDRFEITPYKAFRAADGDTPQRFLINVRDHLTDLKNSTLKLEVSFDDKSGKAEDGMAEITFDFVKVD